MNLDRRNGFDEQVVIEGKNLPSGVTLQALTIPTGEDTATLTLNAAGNATLGTHSIEIEGTAGEDSSSDTGDLLVRDAPGVLDQTFGSAGTGKVLHDFGPNMNVQTFTAASQADGKYLTSGTTHDTNGTPNDSSDDSYGLFIARYDEHGTLDDSFASGGIAQISVASASQIPGLAIQDDGKIVVAGEIGSDFALLRYTGNGNLDSSFGSGGQVIEPYGQRIVLDVVVDQDGRLLVVGSDPGVSDDDLAVRRFEPDGSLDASFGTGGLQLVDFGSKENGNALTVLGDGSIVVAGQTSGPSSEGRNFAVAKLDQNGTPDSTFGTGGQVTHDFAGQADNAYAVLEHDGGVLVGGIASNGSDFDFALLRLNSDGSLDGSFGTAGEKFIYFSNGYDLGFSYAVQEDGKIIGAGTADFGAVDSKFAVTRLLPDGSPDTDFGTDGTVTTSLVPGASAGLGLALGPDSRLLVSGMAETANGNAALAVARYWR